MKEQNELQTINPTEEKIRILRLEQILDRKLTLDYYAERLNRTKGAISQALMNPTMNETLLKRIHRHNNWIERKVKERKQLKEVAA